jgi:hypothetical protein
MKRLSKIFSVVMGIVIVFSVCSLSSSAIVVSGWGVIAPSYIESREYDSNNTIVSIASENLNQSVLFPIVTQDHFKDLIVLEVTTGSSSNIMVAVDDIPLTGNNLTRSYTTHYESTFDLYYYKYIFILNNLSDIVDPDISRSLIKIVTRNPSNSSLDSMNGLNVNWYDERPIAPTTPTFIYNDAENPGKAVLTGVDSTMEYRLKSALTWYDITGSTMTFDLPSANTGYYVRYKNPQSKVKELTMLTVPAAPSVSVNATTEAFSGLKTTMEMKINGGSYFDVTDDVIDAGASSYIDQINSGDTATLIIRLKGTDNAAPGLEQTLTLYPRADMPTNLSFDSIARRINGVSSAMQYRLQGAASWTNITATYIDVTSLVSANADVIVEVRYKAVSGATSASNATTVTLTQLAVGPVLSVDLERDVITGFVSGSSYEYNTSGSATSWTTIVLVNSEFDIYSLISTSANRTFYIRTAKTSLVPATATTQIAVSKRPVAPTAPVIVYNDANYPEQAVLTGVTSGMEYRVSTDTIWTSGTGSDVVFSIPAANATYYVRYKGAGSTTPASANKSLTLSKRAAAPSVTLNITEDTVGSLTTAMEISLDGTNFTAVAAATTGYDVSALIDATSTGVTVFYVRKFATATAPASIAKEILLYPRLSAPTGIMYNPVTCIVNGVANTMQYKQAGATSWTNISGNSLNVESILSDSADIVINVRYKPTTTASASFPVTVTLNQLPTAPSLAIDYVNDVVQGFEVGSSYQYNTNGSKTSWSSVTLTNNEWNMFSLMTTSAKTFYIRKVATSTMPATAPTTISTPARTTAPSAPSFIYNDPQNPDQTVLVNIGSDMEYRLSTATQWASGTGSSTVYDIPTANATYYVRFKGSNPSTPASSYKSLTLSKRANAPSTSLNTTAETIGSLTIVMEMQIGGNGYYAVTQATTAYDVSSLITATTSGTTTISIRTAATSTAPASLSKEIILYPRAISPSGVAYDSATQKITGVNKDMQYRAVGASSWSSIATNATAIAATSLINAGHTQIEVRYKPVANVSSASNVVVVNIG